MRALPILPSPRLRRTPFWDGALKAGVKSCSIYNRMLLPTAFVSFENDYLHLKRHVQLWDVSCQRQVELKGADAAALAQMLTPRFIGQMQIGKCRYVPAVDSDGGMLNDPVLLKLASDRYWFSIADGDLLNMAKGLAIGGGMDVKVFEPDVSPLAVQGPKSDELVRRVFGPQVTELSFFGFDWFPFGGVEHIVSRSGYSGQGGFEIYLDGSHLGMDLWNELMSAGKDLEVRAGCPNVAERIEAGFLSYGNDITNEHTPFECGLGKYCDLDKATTCIGHGALLKASQARLERQIRYLSIEGAPVPPVENRWKVVGDGRYAGAVGSASWSPDFETNVAVGMIEAGFFADGTQVQVDVFGDLRDATVRERPFA